MGNELQIVRSTRQGNIYGKQRILRRLCRHSHRCRLRRRRHGHSIYGIVAWRAEIYIFIAYPEHKIASFIINFGNARPIVMSHRRLVAQHDNPAGRQAQKVLDTVLALQEQKELRMSLSST